jgi:hypothetical protein
MTSPFNWQGKPSIFSDQRAYNGIDTRVSIVASAKAKNTIELPGSNKQKKVKAVAQAVKRALQYTHCN